MNSPENQIEHEQEQEGVKEKALKQLMQVVCICKGISLGKVLKGLQACNSESELSRKIGTGTGGCCGERCGPKINALIARKRDSKL